MRKRKVGVLGDTLNKPTAQYPASIDYNGIPSHRYQDVKISTEIQTEEEKKASKPAFKTHRRTR